MSTLKRRAPEIPIIVYPTPVQGAGSEKQIAQAIATAAARHETDVLIVCRGGGSIEDLWAFNEEPVVRAIEACTIPIVSGVGMKPISRWPILPPTCARPRPRPRPNW